jgi:hypothetical protein
MKFDIIDMINKLVAIGERQLEDERRVSELLKSVLREHGVDFVVQEFDTSVPRFISAELTADGVGIDCEATSFVSGEITNTDTVVSSLISSQKLIDVPNINFNPRCRSISRGNHYFAPSVAVRASDVSKILSAQVVRAKVEVERVDTESENILVGNLYNPQSVLVCHYDSVGPGATDNASGTAMLMRLIVENPELLTDNLFVIGGNEELSYDYPLYWGRGYRQFESVYGDVLTSARQILVVDCVGNGPATFDTNVDTIRLGFPIIGLSELASKISLVYGSFDKLMEVYQSDIDTVDTQDRVYLDQTYDELLNRVR